MLEPTAQKFFIKIFKKDLTNTLRCVIIIIVKGKPITITGQDEKGGNMEGMTNEQYNDQKKTLILLILEMLKNSNDLKEAEQKIRALLEKE